MRSWSSGMNVNKKKEMIRRLIIMFYIQSEINDILNVGTEAFCHSMEKY